jgi:hypothetical protein
VAAGGRGVFAYVDDPVVDPPAGAWGSGGALRRAKGTALAMRVNHLVGGSSTYAGGQGRVVVLDYDEGDVLETFGADPFTLAVRLSTATVTEEISL